MFPGSSACVPKAPMLTDTECRKVTCPPGKSKRRVTDGGGLYLEVSPAGSRRWFWKFYPDGKELLTPTEN